MSNLAPAVIPDAQRSAILQEVIGRYVRAGYSIEQYTPTWAILGKVKRMGLIGNLLLVVFTGGLWLIWVIYRALNRKVHRITIVVEPDGSVRYR